MGSGEMNSQERIQFTQHQLLQKFSKPKNKPDLELIYINPKPRLNKQSPAQHPKNINKPKQTTK